MRNSKWREVWRERGVSVLAQGGVSDSQLQSGQDDPKVGLWQGAEDDVLHIELWHHRGNWYFECSEPSCDVVTMTRAHWSVTRSPGRCLWTARWRSAAWSPSIPAALLPGSLPAWFPSRPAETCPGKLAQTLRCLHITHTLSSIY